MECNAIIRDDAETLFRNNVITCPFDMNEQMKTFGTNLKRQMDSREITAKSLSEKAGVSEKTVNNVVNGRHAAQIDKLGKLAEALGVQFWTMWIPDLPSDVRNDRTIQSILETSTHLSGDALTRIARMAELEWNSEKAARHKRTPNGETAQKR